MKRLAILIAAVGVIGFMTSQAEAQHYHSHRHGHIGHGISHGVGHVVRHVGHVHHGHYGHHRNLGSNFSISIGNGFNGISYSRGYGNYYRPAYRPITPVYYGHRGYGYGGGYRTYGGYGRHYHGCGGW